MEPDQSNYSEEARSRSTPPSDAGAEPMPPLEDKNTMPLEESIISEVTRSSSELPPEAAPDAPEPVPVPPVEDKKRWYVVKIASGREDTIKAAIEKRVKIEGLQEYFGQIVVPVERRTEMVKNKRVVKESKLMPGYLLVNLEFNERMLYLFRETSGVGDFVGASLNKPPQPMEPREIERWIGQPLTTDDAGKPPKPKFSPGEHVRIKDGAFAGMDGTVKEILEAKGAVTVELTIFGRPVPVELEYWQVDYV